MKPTFRSGLLTLLTAALAASAGRAQDDKALAGQARDLLKARCQKCHNGPGSSSGKPFDVMKISTMTARIKDDDPYLTPKDLEKSPIWYEIENGLMPKGEKPLAEGEQATIKKWIAAGAPEFPSSINRKFISLENMLQAIRNDLQGTDRKDRPFRRYFTLVNLHNNMQLEDQALVNCRAALSMALNSLSWKEAIVKPEAVKDSYDTIYAVDIRALDWDRTNLWYEILKEYPYGVRYDNHPRNKPLRELDKDIFELTKDETGDGCPMPMVRADWFVATATRPPLYYTMLFDEYLPELRNRSIDPVTAKLGNPKHMTAYDLEKFLDVNIRANFLNPTPDRISRAGFNKSGVSAQNRMLERSASKFGAYWKSYDFKPDSKRIKISRFPLGPLNLFPEKEHPYPHQAFAHDGGEIIFNLPNGLQAYMLINGNDERIDEGPIQVVSDPNKISGTHAIVDGVSCMSCHAEGIIPFTDRIREGSAVFGKARDKVEDLFPPQAKLDELVKRDSRKYMASLDEAIGPYRGAVKDEPPPTKGAKKDPLAALRRDKDPIGKIAQRHRVEYLTLDDIALELYEKDATALRGVLGEREFAQLGLDVLTKPGGVIARLEWEVIDGRSLMQIVANRLGATPVNIPK